MGGYLIKKYPFSGMSRTQALCSAMQAVTHVPGKLMCKLPSASFVWACSGEEVDPTCGFYSCILFLHNVIFLLTINNMDHIE